MKFILILLLIFPIVLSQGESDAQQSKYRPDCSADIPCLRELGEKKGVFIGSGAGYSYLNNDPIYSKILSYQFNLLTPENEMKWRITEPQRGVFQFSKGDYLVIYARNNSMTVRGHNLCWGKSNPEWLQNGTFQHDEMENILTNHIVNVVDHFKGQITYWDVVNEAIADDPSGSYPDTLKKTIWYPTLPDFIEIAFRTARQTDKDALLFYNDYGGELMGPKSDAIYELLKVLKQKQIPIDGVGLQMHLSLSTWLKQPLFKFELMNNLERLSNLGLMVHITEMDVKLDMTELSIRKQEELQSDVFMDVIESCLSTQTLIKQSDKDSRSHEDSKPICTAFEVWDFTDRYSWLGSNLYPCLFDYDYEPKPSFYGASYAFNSSFGSIS